MRLFTCDLTALLQTLLDVPQGYWLTMHRHRFTEHICELDRNDSKDACPAT